MIYFTPKTDCVQTVVELLQLHLSVDLYNAETHVADGCAPTDGLSLAAREHLTEELKLICVPGTVCEKHGAESLAEAHIPNRGLHVERTASAPTEHHRHLTAADLHLGDIFFIDGEPERVFVATLADFADLDAVAAFAAERIGQKGFAVGACELSTGYRCVVYDAAAKVVLFTGSKLVLGKQVAFLAS